MKSLKGVPKEVVASWEAPMIQVITPEMRPINMRPGMILPTIKMTREEFQKLYPNTR